MSYPIKSVLFKPCLFQFTFEFTPAVLLILGLLMKEFLIDVRWNQISFYLELTQNHTDSYSFTITSENTIYR